MPTFIEFAKALHSELMAEINDPDLSAQATQNAAELKLVHKESFGRHPFDLQNLYDRFDMLDYSLYSEGKWDTERQADEFAIAMQYFNKFKNFFRFKLKHLIRHEYPYDLGHFYYALYKIHAYEQIMPKGHQDKCRIDENFDKQVALLPQNYAECFSGDKTMHAVMVMDGSGDLIHFCNWFAAYCATRDRNKTSVVISHWNREYNEEKIKEFIAELPAHHALRDHPDVTICIAGQMFSAIESKLFTPVVKQQLSQTYRALYVISVMTDPGRLFKLINIGLPCCYINEMGIKLSGKNAHKLDYHEYVFGIASKAQRFSPRGAIGGFFPEYGRVMPLDDVVMHMSSSLLSKLYGAAASDDRTEYLNRARSTRLIVGYIGDAYMPLQHLLQLLEKTRRSMPNQMLVLTGATSIPDWLEDYRVEYNPKLKVVCDKFNRVDHRNLLQLLRTDEQHVYLCSGDNTFFSSIALGKLPFLLKETGGVEEKKRALMDLVWYMESLCTRDMSDITRNQIQECIKFLRTSQSNPVLPSVLALRFFAQHLAPYICEQFEISNQMDRLVGSVEHKLHEPFEPNLRPFIDPLSRRYDSRLKFIVRHYEYQTSQMSNVDAQPVTKASLCSFRRV